MIKTRNTLLALSLWSAMAVSAFAQGTAFTYQGQLSSGGSPVNGSYDVQFSLFSVSNGGSAIAGPVVQTAIGVTNGLLTTTVDFGSVFNGTTNWLELAVRTNGAVTFSPALTPRQQLTPTPYAVYAEKANAAGLTGTVSNANLSTTVVLLNTNQTFTGSNNFAGPVTITRSASGVPSGGSIDASTFLHVNNSATDGNTSSPDLAGIAFGNNSTRQAIVGGTFGNDYLDFYTGGLLTTPKMRIDFNGNVGIGTNNPSTRLDIVGTGTSDDARLMVETTGTVFGPQLRLKRDTGEEWVFVNNGSINGSLNDLQIVQSSVGTRFVIRTNGNVGIGTNTPSTALQVNGTVTATSFSGNGSGLTGLAQLTGGNTFNGNLIVTNGKAGIGTTTPLTDFHVVASQYGALPTGIFEVANCGAPCGQSNYQENIRLLNSNPNGQTGIGFLAASGSTISTTPTAWIGTAYGCCIGNPNDVKIATQSGGVLVDRLYINGGNGNVSLSGGLVVDSTGSNTGVLSSSVPSLLLGGTGSGEGLASKRTAGGNAFGLDFYTDFIARLSVTQGGNVGIGTNNPATKLEVAGEITCTAINITSDRNAKQDFKAISPRDVLAKVAALPITEWQYKAERDKDSASARHIGPMAQDFSAAFALGHDEKHISIIDESGVALAAIQGLNEKLEEQAREKDARIRDLEQSVGELKTLVNRLVVRQSEVSR